MDYIARSQWGARPPAWNPGVVSPSMGVFIHYNGPAVSPAVLAGDYDSMVSFLQQTQRFHMGPDRGWPDFAYSWVVDAVGRIWQGRGWGVAQAATLNWNWQSHSIFLPLGGDQEPSDEQIAGCRRVIAEHNAKFGAGFVKGHQQAPNQTSCPGGPTMAAIHAGRFDPNSETNVAPAPTELEDDAVKPVIVKDPRPDGRYWHVAGNTRFRIESQDEIDALRFLGVQVVDNGSPALVSWLRACKDLGRPRGK